MLTESEIAMTKSAARAAAVDNELTNIRVSLAEFAAKSFSKVGDELHSIGHIFGSDRVNGHSPGCHGSDEIVAVSLLLRIGGELTSGIVNLLHDWRQYAAAALLRQVVEIEYLAWAFETRDKDAERWLRSSRKERESFFTPKKLKQASNGRFRCQDYGSHCELGGHPTPGSFLLFQKDMTQGQMLLVDLLAHADRIWTHVRDWALENSWLAPHFDNRYGHISREFDRWKQADTLRPLLFELTNG